MGIGKPTAVRAAINFLYTGTIDLTYSGVRDILEVADYLQIDDLKRACTDYLSCLQVTTENCVDLSLLASLYDLDIYCKVFEFVRGHLPEVMKQPDFLSLTLESVLELLMDKSLNYVSADDFFTFIVKWVEHDEDSRKGSFERMFCQLELKNMSNQFLEKVVKTSEFVTSSDGCKRYLQKSKHMAGCMGNEDFKDVILLVGGSGLGQFFSSFFTAQLFPLSDVMSVNNVYAYVLNEDRWTELAPLPYAMRQPLVAYSVQSSSLFVIDNGNQPTCYGQDSQTLFLFKYSILEKAWRSLRVKLPDQSRDIIIHNINVANGKIFLVTTGKFYNEQSYMVKEDYEDWLLRVSDDLQQCEMACKLFPKCAKNSKISSCVVEDRYVCVCTSCTKIDLRKTSSHKKKSEKVFFYDTLLSDMFVRQCGLPADTLMIPTQGELHLTKFGMHRYKKFNFNSKQWKKVSYSITNPPVEPTRSDCVFTTFDNQLFVFGGRNSKSKELINSACKYDFSTKAWTKLEDIPKSIFQSGVATVKVPAEHVRCHIDCPHCKYHTARSLASYEIEDPEEEEDDDEEISFEDEDVYNYSDYWDDDYYNEYSDTDWF